MKSKITLILFFILAWPAVAGCSGGLSVNAAITPVPVKALAASEELLGAVKGRIVPARYVRLSFATSGVIAEMPVKEGNQVHAGDTIAQLDTRDLVLEVRVAQDALDLAQATLAQTKRPPLQEDIAVAQAALDKAVAELKSKQKAGPDQLASEKTKVDKAKSAVDAAQARFDRAGGNSNPMIGMASVSLDLEKATQDLNAALADYSKFINTNGLEIAQAQAAVAQAEATLALKKRGPAPEEIAVAQVRVQQAQTALEQAKAGLAKTKLVAPIDGTITGLAMHVGEAVQPGAAVTNIVDLTQLRVETTELDQFGLNRVWMGESVRIIPDAFPDQVLPGHVAYLVPPLPSNSSDIPLNVVTLTFDVQPAGIRSGMTVRVEFLSK